LDAGTHTYQAKGRKGTQVTPRRPRNAFLNSKPIPNALLAALHGVSDLPVAVRFSKDQGSRWVTVCLFGMTVTALFNLTVAHFVCFFVAL